MNFTGFESQVTLLPAQWRRLTALFQEHQGAIAVAQRGSVLKIHTGSAIFLVDAQGHDIVHPNQETLC